MLANTYGWWLPFDASTHGAKIDQMMVVIHIMMAVLFVGWGIFFVYCLRKFRARPGHKATYEPIHAKSAKVVELAVVVAEAVLLVGFSMPVWARVKNEVPTPDKNPVAIKIVGEQFAWYAHYPGPDGKFGRTSIDLVTGANPIGLDRTDPDAAGNVVSRNELHIPVGRPIVCRLRSKDVIHSFYLPVLRVKQDVIPGTEIPSWFEARADVLGPIRASQAEDAEDALSRLARFAGAAKAKGAEAEALHAEATAKLTAAHDLLKVPGGGDPAAALAASATALEKLKALLGGGKLDILAKDVANLTDFDVSCAQLCGLNHTIMRAALKIESQEQFDKWLAGRRQKK